MWKTIRSRVLGTIGLLLGMNLVMTATLYWGVRRMEHFQRDTVAAGQEIRAYMALSSDAARYSKELADSAREIDGEDELEEASARLHTSMNDLESALAANQGWTDRQQALRQEIADQSRIIELRSLLSSVDDEVEVLRAAHQKGIDPNALRRLDEVIETKLEDELLETITTAIDSQNDWIGALDKRGARIVAGLSMAAIVLACFSVLVSLAAGAAFATVILRPIEKLKRGTEIVGKGDLSHRVADVGSGEFGQLAGHFNDMVARLEQSTTALKEAYQLQSDFLSVISHELRSPLHSITGFAELISDEPGLSARSRTHLSRITACAQKLLRLINDILDFSKLRAGRAEVRTAPFALQELLAQVVDEAKVLAQEASTEVTLDVEGDLGQMVSDDLKLRQILTNLMSNAVKFTEQGTVTLQARRQDETKVCFRVMDTGIGIGLKQQRMIFEPFRQVNSHGSRYSGGTGLGLAIVSRLVALLGGEISVRSKLGEGSMFTVVLPDRRT